MVVWVFVDVVFNLVFCNSLVMCFSLFDRYFKLFGILYIWFYRFLSLKVVYLSFIFIIVMFNFVDVGFMIDDGDFKGYERV